ncbi:hypothetical protein CEY16_05560 [Halalkalibacillus sediminis]|uniref:Uncharacterized protein n=1 Tax=Halalkalibacillus sediminis TaxID=2018042 RepID=A0A2I0QY23_9BACI|nr:hypothetical protein [Halalkalibacillus sediminis]PKR79208.1 hypothetical protein CEY16_05560 [Halalkalibacillus sediminis]
MTHGEFVTLNKALEVYVDRFKRALKSNQPMRAMDLICSDMREAFDLKDPSNRELSKLHQAIQLEMSILEVA